MAEVLSTEKPVVKSIIFEANEAALATAARKRHREDIEVQCTICIKPISLHIMCYVAHGAEYTAAFDPGSVTPKLGLETDKHPMPATL